MTRLLTISLACIVLAAVAVGLVVVLAGGGDDEGARPPGATSVLLERGGGPDGSGAVTLTRWRYRADPGDLGLARGWAEGDWRGREVA